MGKPRVPLDFLLFLAKGGDCQTPKTKYLATFFLQAGEWPPFGETAFSGEGVDTGPYQSALKPPQSQWRQKQTPPAVGRGWRRIVR